MCVGRYVRTYVGKLQGEDKDLKTLQKMTRICKHVHMHKYVLYIRTVRAQLTCLLYQLNQEHVKLKLKPECCHRENVAYCLFATHIFPKPHERSCIQYIRTYVQHSYECTYIRTTLIRMYIHIYSIYTTHMNVRTYIHHSYECTYVHTTLLRMYVYTYVHTTFIIRTYVRIHKCSPLESNLPNTNFWTSGSVFSSKQSIGYNIDLG